MANIIAGGFDVYSKTQAALQRLRRAGIAEENLCEFRINPPGEHHGTPIGGDHHQSQGAKHAENGAGKGAAIGAALGVAAGIAATPVIGPAGIVAAAGVGGYTGSLLGSLREVSNETQPDHEDVRPAEAMIAVNVDSGHVTARKIIRILEESGAHQIEQAEGTWENGAWTDFDPVSPPHLIGGTDYRAHHSSPRA